MNIVPKGGLVLVTGANGYIATATIRVLLDHGYTVRGTVRSVEKNKWMLTHFGSNFLLAEVTDINAANAFDEVVNGVAGIIHIAADTRRNPNDNSIVQATVDSTIGLLKAAENEASVKRVVLTSSSVACVSPVPGIPYKVTRDTWNEEAVDMLSDPSNHQDAWTTRPGKRAAVLYAAAKTLGERRAFEWVLEHKPHFVFNSVLPNVALGGVESVKHLGFPSSSCIIEGLALGTPLGTMAVPSQWFVNVEDVANLHVAGLSLEDVQSQRILAFSSSFCWTQVLEILRRQFPKRAFATLEEPAVDKGDVDNVHAVELLKRLGRNGFKTLEETVVENMEAFIEGQSIPEKPKSRLETAMEAQAAQQAKF